MIWGEYFGHSSHTDAAQPHYTTLRLLSPAKPEISTNIILTEGHKVK
jgi:hypothetical protein